MGYFSIEFYKRYLPEVGPSELIIFGLISVIVILFSIVIHELAHLIVSRRLGVVVAEIGFNFFGGIVNLKEDITIPKNEIKICIVGPLTNLIIGTVFLGLSRSLLLNFHTYITTSFYFFALSNGIIAFFNLIPAFPLDGGRVLRAFLWDRTLDYGFSTKVVSKISSILGYGILICGIYFIFTLHLAHAIWLILVSSIFIISAIQTNRKSTSIFLKMLRNEYDKIDKPVEENPKCFVIS